MIFKPALLKVKSASANLKSAQNTNNQPEICAKYQQPTRNLRKIPSTTSTSFEMYKTLCLVIFCTLFHLGSSSPLLNKHTQRLNSLLYTYTKHFSKSTLCLVLFPIQCNFNLRFQESGYTEQTHLLCSVTSSYGYRSQNTPLMQCNFKLRLQESEYTSYAV